MNKNKIRQAFLVGLAIFFGGAGNLRAQNWCSVPMPTPQPGVKIGGVRAFEIGPGKGNGTTDPPCPPALCFEMKGILPADAQILETHLCAADKGSSSHECTPTGNPTWWNCNDNPPYARFSDFREGAVGGKKYARVTFKMWSDNYKNAAFLILYKSGSNMKALKTLNYSKLSSTQKNAKPPDPK